MEWQDSKYLIWIIPEKGVRVKKATYFEIKIKRAKIKWDQNKGIEEVDISSYSWTNSKETTIITKWYEIIQT